MLHNIESLSQREVQVLALAARGFSVCETAGALGTSPCTVAEQRASAKRKLNARDITHAVTILWLAAHHKRLVLKNPPALDKWLSPAR